jgi:hypothetical protein
MDNSLEENALALMAVVILLRRRSAWKIETHSRFPASKKLKHVFFLEQEYAEKRDDERDANDN